MIIVNITILFFLTTIILSLLSKNNEGLTSSNKNDPYTKLLLDNNSKQITAIKKKVILNTNPLNIILNKIKYWKKEVNDTQNKSKSESNEISSDENLVIKKPLPKPIL